MRCCGASSRPGRRAHPRAIPSSIASAPSNSISPRARELAQQTVSIVNLTRAALVNADPVLRRNLLIELNEREGIRLAPVTGGEVLQPLPDDMLFELVTKKIKDVLGQQTRFAYAR